MRFLGNLTCRCEAAIFGGGRDPPFGGPLAAFVYHMEIRKLTSTDLPWVETVVAEHFGSPEVVSRGGLHDSRVLPGFVAEVESERVGLLQYRMDDNQCEVVILISLIHRQGIGRALLKTMESIAKQAGCNRIWLITTNNNRDAIAFYQAVGWTQIAIYPGAVRESRKLKPQISLYDEDGIAIEDEIEFEWRIEGG